MRFNFGLYSNALSFVFSIGENAARLSMQLVGAMPDSEDSSRRNSVLPLSFGRRKFTALLSTGWIAKMLLISSFLLWSCEWTPDQVEIDRESHYVSLNIALGDTVDFPIAGYDLSMEAITIPDVISVTLLDPEKVMLTGIGLGETQLTIRYLIPMVEDSVNAARAIIYLDVTVSDGIPLELILGQQQVIFMADHLSADQIEQIDSISVQLPDDQIGAEMEVNISGTSICLLSKAPGNQRLEVVTFDSLGLQITPLLFETQTSIRKKVLGELFTNAGCAGCPDANDNLDEVFELFPENLTMIRYHLSWPGVDPMYTYNPGPVDTRYYTYSPPYMIAPTLVMDGVSQGGDVSVSGWSATLNNFISTGSDIHIWEPDLMTSIDSLFLDIRIQNFGATVNNLICWSVLTEDSIYYAGTNGESNHMQVMRDMISTEVAEINDEITISHSLKLPPEYAVTENFHIVTFLQDLDTKQILQTADQTI
ncbi:MAG: hypothetical protein U9Q77_13815, partial [Candidatus Marinimicrobia bacterium]|nr:hypothetical protein [Candidatus Neomarinimicrobiota bacterium]